MLERVRHELVDDDRDGDCPVGPDCARHDFAGDLHFLPRKSLLDVIAKVAQMIVQADALQIGAAESEPLRCLGDRTDAVGDLPERFLKFGAVLTLCL